MNDILDDDQFFDRISQTPAAKKFLKLFQEIIGSQFTLRDVCSFYDGLPYTFDLSPSELESADHGQPLKHHCIHDEDIFLNMCESYITLLDPNRCKFHYSEISIMFLGYLFEKIYDIKIESLYQKYVIDAFKLSNSLFSRGLPGNVYKVDLSDKYDYPSIAIREHGYFCYSNGFFTTLHDHKQLLEQLLVTPVFSYMSDVAKARAASRHIMNGLTVEIRMVDDDVIYGYEGLSYSGCNIWAYSTKFDKGYLTTINSEEDAYTIIYGRFGYTEFDIVPEHTEEIYRHFLEYKHYEFEKKSIPDEYVGQYQRVNINDSKLTTIFTVGEHYIDIRNPDPVKYDVLYDHGTYRISCKDHMHGIKVGFHQAKSGHRYMFFDGTLYKKCE